MTGPARPSRALALLVAAALAAEPLAAGAPPIASVAAPGPWLATAADRAEAAVPGYRRLARELRAHGAPAALVDDAESAARDELRHAQVVRALARRFGCALAAPDVPSEPLRSLPELAVDNAIEGCVRGAWSAVVGAWQGATAGDPVVARAMRAVAADDAQHADLAFAVARWAASRLDGADRVRIRQAVHAEIAGLRRDAHGPRLGFEAALGLPGPSTSDALLAGLEADVWSELLAA